MEISWSNPAAAECAASPSPMDGEPVSEPHTHPAVKDKAGKPAGAASAERERERERKRLRHREYVKKSYNKKIVRAAVCVYVRVARSGGRRGFSAAVGSIGKTIFRRRSH
jgi:hypothetical protein